MVKAKQEQRLESHHEVAERHHRRTEEDRAVLAEHAVGEHAAEHGRKINKPGIESVDLRGERLHPERSEYRVPASYLSAASPITFSTCPGSSSSFTM